MKGTHSALKYRHIICSTAVSFKKTTLLMLTSLDLILCVVIFVRGLGFVMCFEFYFIFSSKEEKQF